MTKIHPCFLFAAAALFCSVPEAVAHVSLERSEASPGAPYKAVFRVPHGCDGSATLKVRLQIPEGVIAVKPMPKPGWQLDVVKGKYEKAYPFFHGVMLSEGVKEVAWSGKLLDEHYDEFVVAGYLAETLGTGRTLYFPIVQECEKGVHRWIEIPAAGTKADDYKEPAPGLRLVPKR
jgi:uncharacterized protein YcnI